MRSWFALACLLLPLPSLAGPQDPWTIDARASALSIDSPERLRQSRASASCLRTILEPSGEISPPDTGPKFPLCTNDNCSPFPEFNCARVAL